MALTKKAIARPIQEGAGASFAHSYKMVELVIETIKNTLASDDDILISGFGKFKVNQRAACRDRNPAPGEAMMLKPRKVFRFRYAGKLRKRLNG